MFQSQYPSSPTAPLVSILLLCPQFSLPLLSIIDPQHTNGNDNQWGHLYTLANIANGRILKKVGTPPFLFVVGSMQPDEKGEFPFCPPSVQLANAGH